jgi:predicted dehydrogenase
MKKPEKLRIGVMGCASIAERMVIPAILESDHYEFVLVSSREEAKAKRYAEKFGCGYVVGYEELISRPDIDVVYMPLPTGLHLEWALKTLDAGKHILLEKSLASNLEEAEKIIEKAKEKNLLIQENFMFVFHRQMRTILDLLINERVGKTRCIRSSFGFPPFPDPGNIRYSKSLGGGALLDAGAYTIKITQVLLGKLINVLAGSLTYEMSKDVDVFGGLFLHDSKGTIVETAFGFDNFYQCSLEIWGSNGKITADRIFTAGPGISPKIKIEEQGNVEVLEIEPDNHFLNLLNDFAETVHSGEFHFKYLEIQNQAAMLQAAREKSIKFSKP